MNTKHVQLCVHILGLLATKPGGGNVSTWLMHFHTKPDVADFRNFKSGGIIFTMRFYTQ